MIDCQEFLRQLDEMSMEGPDPSLTDGMREHLSDCESCSIEFQAIQEAWLLLPAALPKTNVNPDLESKLIDRIRSDSRERGGLAPSKRSTSFLPVTFWPYALAATVLAALVAVPIIQTRVANVANEEHGDLAKIEQFAREMERIDDLQQTFGAPTLRYVSLKSNDPTSKVRGYILYDLLAKQGHFFGFELTPMNGGHFVLWLLDGSDQVAASARINVTDEELGSAIIDLPENVSELKSTVVTLEKDTEVRYPSESVVIRGDIDL